MDTQNNPRTENVSTKTLAESGWKLTPLYFDVDPLEIRDTSPAIQNLVGDGFELVGFRLIPASSIPATGFDEALEKTELLMGQVRMGVSLNRSPELVSLAREAAARSAQSDSEDVEEWAKRLLADIKGVSD